MDIINKKFNVDGINIPYNLERNERAMNIRLEINLDNELILKVPSGSSILRAERFLHSKQDWIKKYLNKLTSNNKLLYFGKEVKHEEQFNLFYSNTVYNAKENILYIESATNKNLGNKSSYYNWLKTRAQEYIPRRVKELSDKYGFKFNRISIRNQLTRWGSCSKKGNLSFNYKLMKFEPKIIDYVIIHELCHLIEMNHSPKFWMLVSEIMPDYKEFKNMA